MEIENVLDSFIERSVQMVKEIKVGSYILRISGGFDAGSATGKYISKPTILCYKVKRIVMDCTYKKITPYQFMAIIVEYVGDNINLNNRKHIFYWNDILPFCQIRESDIKMKYNLKNAILYCDNEMNNKRVLFTVNGFDNNILRIKQINDFPTDSKYKLINLNDLRRSHITIINEGNKQLKKTKGDVSWFLPKRKKPIAYSTKVVSDFIEMMAKEHQTIEDIYAEINYDEDARSILKLYIDSGYGKDIAKDFFVENRKEENDDK